MRRLNALIVLGALGLCSLVLGLVIGGTGIESDGVKCGGTAWVYDGQGSDSPGCMASRRTHLGVALLFLGLGGAAGIGAIVVAAIPDPPTAETPYVPVEPDVPDPVS